MLTYKKVNEEIKKLDPTAELVKSFNGRFHYFIGKSVRNAPESAVMIPRLNYLSINSWIEEFKEKQIESERWTRK